MRRRVLMARCYHVNRSIGQVLYVTLYSKSRRRIADPGSESNALDHS